MHTHSPDSAWPFWISLGGETIDACMGSRWLQWMVMCLCVVILVEYWIIAHDWHRLEKLTSHPEGKKALHDLRNIFILCGLCGYGSVVVRAFVPAWSFTVLLLGLLAAVSARYISRLQGLCAIYREAERMESVKRESRRAVDGESPLETLSRVKALLDQDLERKENASRRE